MKTIFSSRRKKVDKFGVGETVFAQGDPSRNVMYIQEGGVKLTVINESGKEAVVAIRGPNDLLGEGCLASQSLCTATATALAPTVLLVLGKSEMLRLLHEDRDFSDRFMTYMLAQKVRVDEDLTGYLLNSSEKRLALVLLRLADPSIPSDSQGFLTKVSQEVLAEMVGTTRSRVNFFMNKFRKRGFIEYGGSMHFPRVNKSLLNVLQ